MKITPDRNAEVITGDTVPAMRLPNPRNPMRRWSAPTRALRTADRRRRSSKEGEEGITEDTATDESRLRTAVGPMIRVSEEMAKDENRGGRREAYIPLTGDSPASDP